MDTLTVTYTRRRYCLTCREPFAVDPKRLTARICVPCASSHPDKRVRERLFAPARIPTESPSAVLSPPGDWVGRAACSPAVAEMFWPLPGQSGGPTVESALKLCSHCPVVRECGKWAIDNRIEEGIWGGMRPGALRRLAEKRRADMPDTPQPPPPPKPKLRSCANCPKQFEPMPEWPNGRLCAGCRSVHNDVRSRIPGLKGPGRRREKAVANAH